MGRVADLLERKEDVLQFIGRDARPGIDHGETQATGGRNRQVSDGCGEIRARLRIDQADPKDHFALVGELDRISDQVDEDLAEPFFVGVDDRRQDRHPFVGKRDILLLLYADLEHADNALQEKGEVKIGRLQFQFAGFDFR